MSTNSGNGLSSFFPASAKLVHRGEGEHKVSVETMKDYEVEIRFSSAEALNLVHLKEFREELEAAASSPKLPQSSPAEYLHKLRLYTELFHSEKGRSTLIQYMTPPGSLKVLTYIEDTLALTTKIEWDGDITVRVNLDAIPLWNSSLLKVHQMAVGYAMEQWRSRVEAIKHLARFGVKMHRLSRALAMVSALTAGAAWGVSRPVFVAAAVAALILLYVGWRLQRF